MNQATVNHIEHLVNHHLTHHLGEERVFFHCKVNIERIREDHVHGDIVYHDRPIEGAACYPHTNINKVVYENHADLKYVLLHSEEEKSLGLQALNIAKHSSRELSIESDELGEWEFECFLTQINKEECGQFLVEAYGKKESIAFITYPKKLHYFLEDAFDTYVLFERLLDKTMQKYGFS
jgi:hypothetical protein